MTRHVDTRDTLFVRRALARRGLTLTTRGTQPLRDWRNPETLHRQMFPYQVLAAGVIVGEYQSVEATASAHGLDLGAPRNSNGEDMRAIAVVLEERLLAILRLLGGGATYEVLAIATGAKIGRIRNTVLRLERAGRVSRVQLRESNRLAKKRALPLVRVVLASGGK